jgi:phosphoenolpyruvate-protein phosphotransferase
VLTSLATRLEGIPGSDGIVLGPAFLYRPAALVLPNLPAASAADEWQRFVTARDAARAELDTLYDRLTQRGQADEAAIFDAQQLMLDDPALAHSVQAVLDHGQRAEHAVAEAIATLAARLAALPVELFAARAIDVRDVGHRLLRLLLGLPAADFGALLEPAIIVAEDLTPSDTASLHPQRALGFCTAGGGATSHSVILARTLGIPAVVGLGPRLLDTIANQCELILDGGAGLVVVAPDAATRRRYTALQAHQHRRFQAMQAEAHQPACTADGHAVEVAANVGELASAREALAYGAEGIGLLRTEFLYLAESEPPCEDQQVAIYRDIFATLPGRPIIVRTLDVGGDKPPSFMQFPPEVNPFLGWRAIRTCLDETELFKTQLRAILRAAVGYPVRLMFPMITGLDELWEARELVRQAEMELAGASQPHAAGVPVGIMVETPAAAVLVDVLAEAADFFSLGTNDLTQYTLAVDRGNPKVARLFQPLHPAVLRLIRQTIEAAHARGKWVGVCGELAGMPKAIPLLVGLGVDELSMAPRAIPLAKALIGRLTTASAGELAARALGLGTAQAVEALMAPVLLALTPPTDLGADHE